MRRKFKMKQKTVSRKKKSGKLRDKSDVFIMDSNGNLNTRINPINRYSEFGFELRMANKLNRKPRTIKSFHSPQFLK